MNEEDTEPNVTDKGHGDPDEFVREYRKHVAPDKPNVLAQAMAIMIVIVVLVVITPLVIRLWAWALGV